MHTPKGKSKGSIGIFGVWEFIIADNGDLYRAPSYNPIGLDGYRQGARFEATAANNHGDEFARYLRIQGFERSEPARAAVLQLSDRM